MSGKKTINNSTPAIGAIKIQQSTYGLVIPVVWGRTRVTGNLIWYGDFKSTPHTEVTQSGGKGGGAPEQTTTTWSYSASVAMALCEGPVMSVRTAWRGKNIFNGNSYSGTTARFTATNTYPPAGQTISLPNPTNWINLSVEIRPLGDFADQVRYNRAGTWITLVPGVDYTATGGVYTFLNSAYVGALMRISYTNRTEFTGLSCLSTIGLELHSGTPEQAPWSYLASRFPDQALGYSGIAYVAGANYTLDSGASVENHAFEIDTSFVYSDAMPDADPSLILDDGLNNPQYGAQFGREKLASLVDYSNACIAQGILLSPALTEQTSAAAFLESLAQLTNAGLVWSGGMLKVIPYVDAPITGNGVTFTPNTTPIYDLTDDDFLPGDDEGPIKVIRGAVSDSFNSVKLEFFDRANAYNIAIMPATDQADIQENGLREMPVVTAHWINDARVAKIVAQLTLQRSLFIRNTYEFTLGWTKIGLEPMDLVTLTDPLLGLDKQPVRILTIEESDSGELSITAEDFPKGSATASLYPTGSGTGYAPNFNEAPGSVQAPTIFEGPAALSASNGGLEVWLATGSASPTFGGCEVWVSLSGSDYRRAATLNGMSRYGLTTSALPSAAAGTVTTDSLGVQLSSGGQLLAASNVDMASLVTLCYADGEFFSYETSTLTGASAYTLGGHMVRGAYLSRVGAHASGVPFVRCDDAIARVPLTPDYIGKTIHIKLLPFNRFGGATGSLADATEYTYTVTGWQANLPPIAPLNVGTEGPFTANTAKFKWDRIANAANYNVQIWATVAGTLTKVRELNVGDALRFDYSAADARSDGGPWRSLTFMVRGIHQNGAAGAFSTYVATNPQVGALTGATATSGPQTVQFACDRPTDPDFSGIQVWISPTSGFAPSAATLVFDGPNTSVTINRLNGGAQLAIGTTYYVRAAAYDSFDRAGLVYTAELPVTISNATGVQTAIIQLYKWGTSAPAKPTGTSTFTWASGANTSYTAAPADNWLLDATGNPGTPGAVLYIATVQISAPVGTATSTVSYSASTVAAWSQNGPAGTSGVQSAFAEVFRWDVSLPAAPIGNATYKWSDGTFGAAPTSPAAWTLSPGTAASAGMTLFRARVNVIDTATNATTAFVWQNQATVSAIGSAGASPAYVDVSATGQVFSRATSAATFAPASITLTATPFGGTATYQWQYWTGSAWTNVASAGTSATYTVASGDFTDARPYRVQATIGGNVYADQVTLYQVTGGANAISGFLTNEAATLPATNSGTVSDFSGASGTFKVYDGTTDKTGAAVTYSAGTQTNCTVAITAAGAYTVSAMTADSATAVLQAVYGGVTIQKTLSLAKARAGAQGSSVTGPQGVSYVIAFCVTTTATASGAPAPTTGKTSLPADNSSGLTGTWSAAVPSVPAGSYLFQAGGLYDPTTNTVTWEIPYWSYAKFGTLSAITANMGQITAGQMDIGTGNTSFHIDPAGNQWSGSPSYAAAPYKVSNTGDVVAKSFTATKADGTVLFTTGAGLALAGVPAGALNSEIVVGGRNLLRNSGQFNQQKVVGWESNGSTISLDTTTTYEGWPTLKLVGLNGAYNSTIMRVKPDTLYTISAVVKGSSALSGSSDTHLHIQCWRDEDTGNVHQDVNSAYQQDIGTGWTRVWQTFKTPVSASQCYVRMYFFPLASGYTLNVGYAKLEEGNKYSDWSPAPEDVAAAAKSNPNLVESLRTWYMMSNASLPQNDSSSADGAVLVIGAGGYAQSHPMTLVPNTDYVLSFRAKAAAATPFSFDLFPDTLPQTEFTLSTAWQSFSVKWNSSSADMASCTLRALGVFSSAQVQICDIKLERGPIATPWNDSVVTPFNASTYIQALAIDSAMIKDLRTVNYAEDGSGNATAGGKVSSTGTTIKVANNGLQVGTAVFSDYWFRLVQGIDGSVAAGRVIWRGNNDITTRGGSPNIACLSLTPTASQVVASNFQQVYYAFTIQPTAYANYQDNLDAMRQIHLKFYTPSAVYFNEVYAPCPDRVYDGSTYGTSRSSLSHGWRYSGGGSVPNIGPYETNGVFTGYIRARISNTYGWSADQDFAPGTAVGTPLTPTSLGGGSGGGGSGGSGGGGGGACPAPWVPVRLITGKDVPAGDLYNGARLAAVNDTTMEPVRTGGVVRDFAIIWAMRYRVRLTDGAATEWSENHRFAVEGRGWTHVQNLRAGDHILGQKECIVESVLAVGEGQVVSFRVEGAGTYFAGGMLSHNFKQIP